MKKIEMIGKHQSDVIKKCNDPNFIAERTSMLKYPDLLFTSEFQLQLINKLYLDEIFEYKNEMLREIDKKIKSYIKQDINKNKFTDDNISKELAIEKLVSSKLRCFYCNNEMKIFYKNVREKTQWTLDRIDNSISHKYDNVVVSCLKCNLERRCQDKNKFYFSKQLKIIKSD